MADAFEKNVDSVTVYRYQHPEPYARADSGELFDDLLSGFLLRNAARNRADYDIDLDRAPTGPIAQARLNYTKALNEFNLLKFGIDESDSGLATN